MRLVFLQLLQVFQLKEDLLQANDGLQAWLSATGGCFFLVLREGVEKGLKILFLAGVGRRLVHAEGISFIFFLVNAHFRRWVVAFTTGIDLVTRGFQENTHLGVLWWRVLGNCCLAFHAAASAVNCSCFYHQFYQQIIAFIVNHRFGGIDWIGYQRNLQKVQSPFPPYQKPTEAFEDSAMSNTFLKQVKQGMRNTLLVLFYVYLHIPFDTSALSTPMRFKERTASSVESEPNFTLTEKKGSISIIFMLFFMFFAQRRLFSTIQRQLSPLSQFWISRKSTGRLLSRETSRAFMWFMGLAMLNRMSLLPILPLTALMNSVMKLFNWCLLFSKKLKGESQTIPSNSFSLMILAISSMASQNLEESLPMA